MAKGIIYVMSSCVDGLVKIGKTGCNNFEQRMSNIERDDYHRVSVLKREFAIEVDDYDEKELLFHEIFSKSRVGDSELFSVDLNLVKQLMASFEGKVVYPPNEDKGEIFGEATEVIEVKNGIIPDGEYTMSVKAQKSGMNVKALMIVEKGVLILKAGATIAPLTQKTPMSWMKIRSALNIENNIFAEDLTCSSPSMAAAIVCGHNKNGWETWKNKNGEFIDVYRQEIKAED